MVGTNLKIDERSKLEKLKDMVSEIAEFDTVFDVATDSEAVEASSPEDDIPVEALLSAFVSKTYGGGNGNRARRNARQQPFDESTFTPRETFSTISKDGKIKWASIPKED